MVVKTIIGPRFRHLTKIRRRSTTMFGKPWSTRLLQLSRLLRCSTTMLGTLPVHTRKLNIHVFGIFRIAETFDDDGQNPSCSHSKVVEYEAMVFQRILHVFAIQPKFGDVRRQSLKTLPKRGRLLQFTETFNEGL